MKSNDKINSFFKNPNSLIFVSSVSVLTTLIFAVYNAVLGFLNNDSWGISIFVYYLCLTLARLVPVICEKKIGNRDENEKYEIRRKTYIGLSSFMFFIDLCLASSITLMVVCPKQVAYGIVIAITVAVYTVYKITAAIINFHKSQSIDNLSFRFLRKLSVVDALVSVLTLQHTLIMVNGGMSKSMMIVSACSSFVIWFFIIVFSAVTLKKDIKRPVD